MKMKMEMEMEMEMKTKMKMKMKMKTKMKMKKGTGAWYHLCPVRGDWVEGRAQRSSSVFRRPHRGI